MNHFKTIGIKFLIIGTIVFSMFGIFGGASLTDMFIISLLVTAVAYVVGDLFILPRFGNLFATIADFGLAFLSLWILGLLFFAPEFGIVPTALFTAFFIACTEAVFHIYVNNQTPHDHDEIYLENRRMNAQTEFAEENPDKDYIKRHHNTNKNKE
ncbi:YndM family protein [Aquibacillus sediminis]|uniref:YndM family protein n=1 Tax=Aquibacillus sediminis TaxID=2574734 RepID=UPI001108050E|nr:YndM family protein [Aquibacillus sediminis]